MLNVLNYGAFQEDRERDFGCPSCLEMPPQHRKLPANAAHQAHGKCHLKLKNEKKTLGRTRGRRGIDLSWQMSLPQKLFVYLGNMFPV